jgi:hypothetical protein
MEKQDFETLRKLLFGEDNSNINNEGFNLEQDIEDSETESLSDNPIIRNNKRKQTQRCLSFSSQYEADACLWQCLLEEKYLQFGATAAEEYMKTSKTAGQRRHFYNKGVGCIRKWEKVKNDPSYHRNYWRLFNSFLGVTFAIITRDGKLTFDMSLIPEINEIKSIYVPHYHPKKKQKTNK